MKQSQLFTKIKKEAPSDAESLNAIYLERAGFIKKNISGSYALLPLGYRVYAKIEKIIREAMNDASGQEILMNVLQPKELWDETHRWTEMKEIFYQFRDAREKEIGLAPTHEEQITDIIRQNNISYKDLPIALYQIQTKFRNEARAKSGLLRGREFIMKDLYSFHATAEDLEKYYNQQIQVYSEIFQAMGLNSKVVEASGGAFSRYSHEFQVISESGEDEIFYCSKCDFAQNKEIAEIKAGDNCPKCADGKIESAQAIEVGNIFKLGTKFSDSMKANFVDENGSEKPLLMGCYGIGLTRLIGTVVEIKYDKDANKMVWPRSITPFDVHLISLGQNETANEFYDQLKQKNIEVLYDDRELSFGSKFAEADLIGCPIRIIVSAKTIAQESVEVNYNNKIELIKGKEILQYIQGLK